MWEQCEVLKHHADVPTFGLDNGGGSRKGPAIHRDGAAHGPFEPGDPAKQGGLSAATRTKQAADLVELERKRRLRHHGFAAVRKGKILETQHVAVGAGMGGICYSVRE